MLREAQRRLVDHRALYEAHWRRTFDHRIEYWREEVGRGHAQKPRADLFLQSFLAMRLGTEAGAGHLFSSRGFNSLVHRDLGASEGVENLLR